MKEILVLGIETSCDETGVAIYSSKRGLLAHALHTQVDMHLTYGGIVPELASRDHIRMLLPLIHQVLTQAGLEKHQLSAIAYTQGPGLVGALLVGASFAKTLAWTLNIPAIGIHHMEGHLLAPMLETEKPSFPFVALLVSGGHTQLVEVQGLGQYRLLGDTLDDAAGEAFDKTARLLGLEYPGGPKIAKLAEQGQPGRFHFPRPMIDRPGLDFSFSGLKTAALQTISQQTLDAQTKADIAYAFQEAVVDTLVIKCTRAMKQTGQQQLVIAGGVSANKRLREKLQKVQDQLGIKIYYPRLEFCTDNGAMIAYAGYLNLQQGHQESLAIEVKPRWPMEHL